MELGNYPNLFHCSSINSQDRQDHSNFVKGERGLREAPLICVHSLVYKISHSVSFTVVMTLKEKQI